MVIVKLFTNLKISRGCVIKYSYRTLFWKPEKESAAYSDIVSGLQTVYKNKLLPLEEKYLFHDFHSPRLNDADFAAKPLVLLMGQYSTGKTTLIKHLLGTDFPGIHIGPEPTTDRFIVVMHNRNDGIVPGNALVVDPKYQFQPLSKFGNAFLNRFQASFVSSEVLKTISIIDTPGILSGEKQRLDRGYDFTGVLKWFAERVDRIILLFDAHKLDISDEFRRSIQSLQGNDDKIRIVLNKADMVDHQQLMRVYGALMYSLGKILHPPEVPRVYIGSFWDEPLRFATNRRLFEDEKHDLFKELQSLPNDAALRKLSDISKRARLVKVHACIIGSLYSSMPRLFGRDSAKEQLIGSLEDLYENLEKKLFISPGDFPNINEMKRKLSDYDFSKFCALDSSLMNVVDQLLAEDISKLMHLITIEKNKSEVTTVKGGVFDGVSDTATPFGHRLGEGIDAGMWEPEWIVSKYKDKYSEIFNSLNPVDGKLMRTAVKDEFEKSKLPSSVLSNIYNVCDMDNDSLLDLDEFSLAMYLIDLKLKGHNIPSKIPDHLVPPSKKLKVEEVAER